MAKVTPRHICIWICCIKQKLRSGWVIIYTEAQLRKKWLYDVLASVIGRCLPRIISLTSGRASSLLKSIEKTHRCYSRQLLVNGKTSECHHQVLLSPDTQHRYVGCGRRSLWMPAGHFFKPPLHPVLTLQMSSCMVCLRISWIDCSASKLSSMCHLQVPQVRAHHAGADRFTGYQYHLAYPLQGPRQFQLWSMDPLHAFPMKHLATTFPILK